MGAGQVMPGISASRFMMSLARLAKAIRMSSTVLATEGSVRAHRMAG